jgi:two-component system, NarL family, sensor kinase
LARSPGPRLPAEDTRRGPTPGSLPAVPSSAGAAAPTAGAVGPQRPEPAPVADREASDPLRAILERVGQITRDSQEMLQQLVASERRFRRLAKAVWRVQEEERRRLARELHDGLGQNLTALKNRLELLARQAATGETSLCAGLEESVTLTARLLKETRELSRLLRPPILDDLGLAPALAWLARTLREASGLTVHLDIDLDDLMDVAEGAAAASESGATREPAAGGGARAEDHAGPGGVRLGADHETLIFRIAQEALTNVVKHSGAPEAELVLRAADQRLRLSVADRGAGFDLDAALAPEAAAGCGLAGMRDRVELFGGRFAVHTAPAAGTRIEIEVPLPAAAGPET